MSERVGKGLTFIFACDSAFLGYDLSFFLSSLSLSLFRFD